MSRPSRVSILLPALVLLVLALPSSAFGQATRTWVSGVGDDANPCSRTAPCKTFAGSISKTAAGGEINVIDPGGFGGVTITKSITIKGRGPGAGVLVSRHERDRHQRSGDRQGHARRARHQRRSGSGRRPR